MKELQTRVKDLEEIEKSHKELNGTLKFIILKPNSQAAPHPLYLNTL